MPTLAEETKETLRVSRVAMLTRKDNSHMSKRVSDSRTCNLHQEQIPEAQTHTLLGEDTKIMLPCGMRHSPNSRINSSSSSNNDNNENGNCKLKMLQTLHLLDYRLDDD